MPDQVVSVAWECLSARARGLKAIGVLIALGLPGLATAAEVWVLPNDVTNNPVGTWPTTDEKDVYFSLAIPDDFDSFNHAVLLAIGTDGDGGVGPSDDHDHDHDHDEDEEPVQVTLIVDLSVSGDGLAADDYVDTAIVPATLTNGVLTEIDISTLLDINYVPGIEYLSLRIQEDSPGNSEPFQLAGLRVAYTSVFAADADATNELNTNVQLNGTLLEVTDAGGTL